MALKPIPGQNKRALEEMAKCEKAFINFLRTHKGSNLHTFGAAKKAYEGINLALKRDTEDIPHILDGSLVDAMGKRQGRAKSFAYFKLLYGLLCVHRSGEAVSDSLSDLVSRAIEHRSSGEFLKRISQPQASLVTQVFLECLQGSNAHILAMSDGLGESLSSHVELAAELFTPLVCDAFQQQHHGDPILRKKMETERKEIRDSWELLRLKVLNWGLKKTAKEG